MRLEARASPEPGRHGDYYHHLVEAMKVAVAAPDEWLTDPE